MGIISICKTWLCKNKIIYISWIQHKFPLSFYYSAHAQSAVNLINNLTSACLYEDCFRYLTGGKIIKYVLQYLLFLCLSKCCNSAGSQWEFVCGGNPKHSSFGAQRAAPMTHLYWRGGFILFLGEARSEISASALQLGTVSAGGNAHHHHLIKDLYPFRRFFSFFFCQPYLLRWLRAV